jgi:triacylglycerol lipase
MKCDTKYPILLIHGCGFRDRELFNYWGRIPAALEEEGAQIYYGNQDSWGNVEYNAAALKDTLNKILAETNKGKVNIIAHSKGGLEARFMISSLGMADKVVSLTTIATPHHGSFTIDLLCKLPKRLFRLAAFFTDPFFRFLGDQNPDFYTTCRQFSAAHMKTFNKQNPDAPSIYYQSYAAVMKNPFSDLFLFWPNLVVSILEGRNDGLLTPESAAWTNFRGVWHGATRRGISHADEVDMRRMNFSKKTHKKGITDMREIYIDIVSELKERGL